MPLIAGFGMLIHTKSRRTPLKTEKSESHLKFRIALPIVVFMESV